MRRVLVSKAMPVTRTAGDLVEDVEIVIGGAPGLEVLTSEQAQEAFRNHAKQIAHALATSLPGGTLDQLTALLLERKASSLRVRSRG